MNHLTPNISLKKPDYKDPRWDIPLNENFDILDSVLAGVGHNYIDNGCFHIWQRGRNFSAVGMTADRWSMWSDRPGGVIVKRESLPYNASSPHVPTSLSMGITYNNAGADTRCILRQRIMNIDRLRGRKVTLSFWANEKKLSNSKVTVAVYPHDGTSPHTGATKTISISKGVYGFYHSTFNLSDCSGLSVHSGNGFVVELVISSHTQNVGNGEMILTGVKLNVGGVPAGCKEFTYDEELARCQLHYINIKSKFRIPTMCYGGASYAYPPPIPWPTMTALSPITLTMPNAPHTAPTSGARVHTKALVPGIGISVILKNITGWTNNMVYDVYYGQPAGGSTVGIQAETGF